MQSTEVWDRAVKHQSILIIDDDPIQHRLIAGALCSVVDAEVVTMRSGQDALKLLRNGRLDVSVMMLDVYMPEFDGAEVIRELAQFDCDTGIVIMSVNERVLPAVKTMATGFGLNVLGTMPKPIDRSDLAMVKRWHDRAGETPASRPVRRRRHVGRAELSPVI